MLGDGLGAPAALQFAVCCGHYVCRPLRPSVLQICDSLLVDNGLEQILPQVLLSYDSSCVFSHFLRTLNFNIFIGKQENT